MLEDLLILSADQGEHRHSVLLVTRNPVEAKQAFLELHSFTEKVTVDYVKLVDSDEGSVSLELHDKKEGAGALSLAFTSIFLLTHTALGRRQVHVEKKILACLKGHTGALGTIVRLSAQSRFMSGQPSNSPFRWHHECDEQLLQEWGDMGVTLLRPSLFMQDLSRPMFAPDICSTDTFYNLGEYGAGDCSYRIAMVDARDIADVAAQVLVDPMPHTGNTYVLTGPEALNWSDVASALSKACGRAISARYLSDRAFFEKFYSSHVWLKQMQAYRSGAGEDVAGDIEIVLGQPPRSISKYAIDHKQLWGKGGKA